MAPPAGYESISFKGWRSLDGLLDNDVLQMLADAAPKATEVTFDQKSSLGVVTSLTFEEQI